MLSVNLSRVGGGMWCDAGRGGACVRACDVGGMGCVRRDMMQQQ
jgi:hypothetical protein